ncbi:MAG: DUF302 domain-containing protein, partial [bacterium]
DLDTPFEPTGARVKECLAAEGFGVLSEIDVQAAMREKIGEEVGEYLILGACNPQLAHRGLGVEPDPGVLLPCNVVVRANEGGTRVAAMEPLSAMELAGNDDLEPIASEARERIERAVTAI